MSRRIKFIKIELILSLIILMASLFSLGYDVSETAFAPFIGDASAPPVLSLHTEMEPAVPVEEAVTSDVPETADIAVSDAQIDSYDQTDEPLAEEFVTIRMELSGITQGNLILVNHDNRYEIPESNDFVNISAVKTSSYMVSGNWQQLDITVTNRLNEMMDAFYSETGSRNVTIRSAFRDYNQQQAIHNEYISLVGRTEASKWAAPPGHSEHHTGLAVDFGVFSDGEVKTFPNTGIYSWFTDNSYKYGFIHRFPADKTAITNTAHEPCHYRYVG